MSCRSGRAPAVRIACLQNKNRLSDLDQGRALQVLAAEGRMDGLGAGDAVV